MNDVSGGGLNNEGMQIVVSNRSISYSQSVYNRLAFPQLLDAFGITEWEITLTPHEEEDEIMQLRRDEMAIRNMMQMKQSGYEAKLRDQIDDKYLTFDFREPSEEEIEAAKQEQMAAEAAKGGGGGAPPAAPVQKSDDLVKESRPCSQCPTGYISPADERHPNCKCEGCPDCCECE